MIRLEKVYAKNVWDIIKLEVEESQDRFVASNKESIIDAYTAIGTDCSAFPFGIYDDEEPVGFLMIGFNEAALEEIYEEEPLEVMKNNYLLWRLMVDKKYQKGDMDERLLNLLWNLCIQCLAESGNIV